jgi:uncharacterized Tic20 family protein
MCSEGGECAARENLIMSWHTLFWMLCAVIVAYVVVAAIAIIKAYREDAAHRPHTLRLHN